MLVLGSGKSGRAVVDYLLPLLGIRVSSLSVAAGQRPKESEPGDAPNPVFAWADEVRSRGARVAFDHEVIEGRYDLCIASPGISQFSAFYKSAQAASAEIISEVEFAWRESAVDSRWVAITGTNGKTTTTALCAHLLNTAAFRAKAVGNIGDACIEAVASGGASVYVVEVSSFQLASTKDFAPDVAILLNITPDHLTWHKTMEAYVEAKERVLANLAQRPSSVAVLNATDEVLRTMVKRLAAKSADERGFDYVPLGAASGIEADMRKVCGSDNAAFLRDGSMLCLAFHDREIDILTADDLRIRGTHNVENALAAATAALVLGADPASVALGLKSFEPLPHRIEPVGAIAGVSCYNDSKATNVDATLKALTAFPVGSIIILLGGRDKGTDLEPLVASVRRCAKAAVCFGEGGPRFFEALTGGVSSEASKAFKMLTASQASKMSQASKVPDTPRQPCIILQAKGMEDALDTALSVAEPGDVILLSPACASFDEFSCFEERGERFRELVAQRAAERGR